MLIKAMVEDRTHWLKPFVQQIKQIGYYTTFTDEVMADFMFIANKEINPDADDFGGMSSKQFFALVKQLPGYEGAVRRRFIREAEYEKKRKQNRIAGLRNPKGDYNWKLLAAKSNGGKGLEMGSNPNE